MKDVLRQHFENLELPKPAIEWLLMLWHVIQVYDDFADGDPVSRDEIDTSIWFTLVGINANTFFRSYTTELLPVLANSIMKWQASDAAERQGKMDACSFVWRAAYYDVVMMVVLLCFGHEKAATLARTVMNMYGEDYNAYMDEMSNA